MIENNRLRVGVCGLGSMGALHARVYTELPGAELVAVCDKNSELLDLTANRYHAAAYSELRPMLEFEQLDALSVCLPTPLHAEAALLAIEMRVATLIEKPLADRFRDGERMRLAARQSGVLLVVGHIERFNPAIQTLRKHLLAGAIGKIFQYSARRVGPAGGSTPSSGVLLDLATHDIDVVRYLSGSELRPLWAIAECLGDEKDEVLAIAALRLEDGAVFTLEANRLSPEKRRELVVLGQKGMFVANYLTQELAFFANDYAVDGWQPLAQLRGAAEGTMTRLRVPRAEPLRLELESFLDSIRGGKQFLVTVEDALATLEVAEALAEIARSLAGDQPSAESPRARMLT